MLNVRAVFFRGVASSCVGRASFRVWPPSLRERPRWEGHEDSTELDEAAVPRTIYDIADVRGTHVSPGSVGTTTAFKLSGHSDKVKERYIGVEIGREQTVKEEG